MKVLKNVAIKEHTSQENILEKIELLIQKATNTKLSKTLLNYISQLVEFIKGESIFDNLRFKWEKEKEELTVRLHSLELRVYNKSKMTYDTLKSRLVAQKLIDLPEIGSVIAELETLFESNELNCSPLPWQLAFDGVKALGIALEKINRTDLLNGLAELRKVTVRSEISNDLEFSEEKLIVDQFIFADGVTELTQLQNDFYFRIEKTPWAVWEKLIAIRWCLKTPFKYWTNKRLRYSTRFYRKEAWQRLNLHVMWAEVNKIKTHSNEGREFLIQRKLLLKYLQTLSEEVCDYLKVYRSIEQFHFFLDGECLWIVLKIEQTPDSYEFFMIKEFVVLMVLGVMEPSSNINPGKTPQITSIIRR